MLELLIYAKMDTYYQQRKTPEVGETAKYAILSGLEKDIDVFTTFHQKSLRFKFRLF